MLHQQNSPPEQSLGHSRIRIAVPIKLQHLLYYLFTGITVLAIFIPLNPKMPSAGLDPSWEFALNRAVAQHMSFGREIVFTYGPYASVITRMYDPATDRRALYGSLLIGVSYLTALLLIAHRGRRYLTIALLLFLATYGFPELLLLSYAFLLGVYVLKETSRDSHDKPASLNWQRILVVVVLLSVLGLLPLVKGTFLLPVGACAAISSAFLVYSGRLKQAVLPLVVPVAAGLIFWIIAGQSLGDLPGLFRGFAVLTSGYTEALSTTWSVIPPMVGYGLEIASLGASALVFLSVIHSTELNVGAKWMLVPLFFAFMLVPVKHGLVTVAGMSAVFASLSVFVMTIGFLYLDKCLIWALSVLVALTVLTSVRQDPALISAVHEKFGIGVTWRGGGRSDVLEFCLKRAPAAYSRSTYKRTWDTYSGAWDGVRSRLARGNDLREQYVGALAGIRKGYSVPPLKGSVDIYTNDQSVLLASDNKWDPRPMFQSVTSYTPYIMRLNKEHLRRPDSPDWVLFAPETINERLPSMEDGASWPALLDNYSLVSSDSRFVLLRKKSVTFTESKFTDVYKESCRTGATVALPRTDGPWFAEVDLKPTMAGSLVGTFYRPPRLQIVLRLRDGRVMKYRVVSNMMATGFFVSPLVSSAGEFGSLFAGSNPPEGENKVESMSIVPEYGGSAFWSDSYVLTLRKYIHE